MSAIEVLKKYSNSCSVCKYSSESQCMASGGEFGECKLSEELSKAINEALLALEKQEELKKLIKNYQDEQGEDGFDTDAGMRLIEKISKVLGELK